MSFENLPDDVRLAIINELRAQKKISAIKLYKDATGLSLLESKRAVEALSGEAGENSPAISQGSSPNSSDEILDAIYRGEKLQAVKLYRNHAGVSLREAKEFIEDLTDQLREEAGDQFKQGNGGCLGLAVLASLAGFLWLLAATQA